MASIISLGQKTKLSKTNHNPFYKNITVVLCKKPLRKTKYWRNETTLKIGDLPKAIAHEKAIALQDGQFG